MTRGVLVEEIYYIVEGTASKLDKRNRKEKILTTDDLVGEFALVETIKPKFTVRAESFMLAKLLKLSDFKNTMAHYPEF
jgi:hypothetical protein